MYRLIYGNAYFVNVEQSNTPANQKTLQTAALDFLDSLPADYLELVSDNGNLPEDWMDISGKCIEISEEMPEGKLGIHQLK